MSVLVEARDAIRDRIAATTPPSDTATAYRPVKLLATSDGSISRRMFYVREPSGGQVTAFGSLFSQLRWDLEVIVRMDLSGRTFETGFDDFANEGIRLLNRINMYDGWPNGVDIVQCTGFRIEPADDGAELILSLVVETEESDGNQ